MESILTNLQSSDYARITLVIVNGSRNPPSAFASRLSHLPRLPFSLYRKLDYRLFSRRVAHDAFHRMSTEHVLRGVPTMTVTPLRRQSFDRFRDEDVRAVLAHEIDVLLQFGFRTIEGPMLQAARFGVWSLVHGVAGSRQGSPALFWEMFDRSQISVAALQIVTDDPGEGRVIYRSIGRVDLTSLFRSRNENSWKAARFVERRLLDLHDRGPGSLASASADVARPAETRGVPGPMCVATVAARAGVEFGRAQVRRRTNVGQWFVAWGPREDRIPGIDYHPSFRELPSPPGYSLADPFLAEHDGRIFAFVELLPQRGPAADIAVFELGAESPSEPVTVLHRDYHLSYPAVFRWNDAWFMTPETSRNRTVELYRAVEFPWRWDLDTVLLSGLDAVDPTLFEHHGRWWLYANIASFGASLNDELHLFWAESPRGPFIPHGSNPVVSDVRRSRPAGRPFVHDGNLYRPAQNCAIRYGHSISINRIDQLDIEQYREVPVGKILPSWLPGAIGTHTFNMSERYVITDGYRMVPRWGTVRPARPT